MGTLKFFLAGILILSVFPHGSQAQWIEENVSNHDGKRPSQLSALVLDAAENAHIAYIGDGNKKRQVKYEIFYTNNVAGAWSTPIQLTNLDLGGSTFVDIAIDANGDVHIVFDVRNDVALRDIYYLKRSGGTWSAAEMLNIGGILGANPKVAASAVGAAHVVFAGDEVNTPAGEGDLFYTTNESGIWSTPLVLTPNPDFNRTAIYCSITLDQFDNVHIAFQANGFVPAGGDYHNYMNIYYTNNIGGPFVSNAVVVASTFGEWFHAPSLAIDGGGNAHIGYMQKGNLNGHDYYYVNNIGGSFGSPMLIFTQRREPMNTRTLAVDSGDKVHLAVASAATNAVDYATNASGGFVNETISGATRVNPSIGVDGDGFAHISAVDPAGGTVSTTDAYYYSNSGVVSATECFIQNITMSLAYKGNGKPSNRGWTATATVLIHDNQGNPVSNATVSGDWSGLTSDSDTGTTGSDGTVSLDSDRINATGTFTFTVTGVSHSSLTYNPSLNVMTSNSISNLSKRSLIDSETPRSLPTEFRLFQNHPNPFNPETSIRFALPEASQVEVTIYNTRGQLIRQLVSTGFVAGEHSITWDGRDQNGNSVSSGVYLYKIQAGNFRQVKKMSLLR